MEALRIGVTTLSVFLLIGGALLMLLPSTGAARAYKFLLSLMTVLLILTCFSVEIDLDFASFENTADIPQNTAESVRKSYITAAESATAKVVQESLQDIAITPQEIFVRADISADNSIRIEYIEVILKQSDAHRTDEAYQALKTELGGQITVKTAEVERVES